jgi:aspartate racemase
MPVTAAPSISNLAEQTLRHAAQPPRGVVGVLGGMGPLATVDFLHKMLLATPAAHDQDHVPVLACNMPQIPDRTEAYRGQGPSPLPAMLGCAQRLVAAGAGLIVVPCNTAHFWFDELQREVQLPMLHIVDAALAEASPLTTSQGMPIRVGLLATDATLSSGLYMNRRPARTEDLCAAFQWSLPTAVEMMEHVMPGINAVKSGQLDIGRRHLNAAARALVQRGAQVLILACTEIPLVLGDIDLSVPVVDATAALAKAAVAWSQRAVTLEPPP